MKKVVIIFIVLFAVFTKSTAQDSFTINMGAGIVSKYVIRGVEYGKGSFQPDITFSYKGAFLNGWAYIPFDNNNFKELDLTLGYYNRGFTVSVVDYISFYPKNMVEDNSFTNFNDNHQIEIHAGYSRKFFAFKWFTTVAGYDGVNSKGERAYTSYMSVGVPISLPKFDIAFEIGATPYSTSSFKTNKFAVVDLNMKLSKDIFINKYLSVPIFAQIGVNPHYKDPYLVLGVILSCYPLSK